MISTGGWELPDWSPCSFLQQSSLMGCRSISSLAACRWHTQTLIMLLNVLYASNSLSQITFKLIGYKYWGLWLQWHPQGLVKVSPKSTVTHSAHFFYIKCQTGLQKLSQWPICTLTDVTVTTVSCNVTISPHLTVTIYLINTALYRVTHHLESYLLLTSKQKVHCIIDSIK